MARENPVKSQKLQVMKPVDSRLQDAERTYKPGTEWVLKGELFLNCSCEVFCPCVISLGRHKPTEGHCHAWMAIHIDQGHYGDEPLDGIDIGLMVEIPGRMGEGDWRVAVYVDDSASHVAYHGILQIISGKAGGTTGVLDKLVSTVMGAERTKVVIEREGTKRRLTVGRKIQGEIEQVLGHENKPVEVLNTKYWMGPDIQVARGTRSRLRAKGRVWDFDGKSGEICRIDWSGPER